MWTENDIQGIEYETHYERIVKVYKDRPHDINIIFRKTVEAHPKREALVMDSTRLSYKEMWSLTENIAGNLYTNFNVKKGDRIALLLGNCIEFALLFFACSKLGSILVPLNTRLAENEISFMIKQSGSSIIITDEEFKSKVNQNLNYKFLIGGNDDTFIPYAQLEKGGWPCPEIEIDEEDSLYVMYTSGTTGIPKGAVGTHIGVLHSIMSYQRIFKTDYRHRSLIAVPLFHVTGLVGELLHIVYIGGTNVLMRRYKAEEFNKILSQEEITFTFNVPSIVYKV